MANIKSQIKRIKTNEKSHQVNKSFKSQVKTAYNKAVKAINEKDKEAQKFVTEYTSLADKAANKGIFHANKAANLKSKINKKFNKINKKNKADIKK
ncbi:MAG: 30S ribosomal protein S20 [Spiroplasma sp.]|nr:30S ribosomal protein S20 [Spiroplasma sp.]